MVRAAEAYERIIPNWNKDMLTKMGVEMRAYFDLMKKIAVAYNNSTAKSGDSGRNEEEVLSNVRSYNRSGSSLW